MEQESKEENLSKKTFRKKKKREVEVKRKLHRRKIAKIKQRQQEAKEREEERMEMILDREIQMRTRLETPAPVVEDKSIPKQFLPKPNAPCICGSKKKFKVCCMREIQQGKIKVIPKYDPNVGKE